MQTSSQTAVQKSGIDVALLKMARHVARKWYHKLIRLASITFIPLRWINNVENVLKWLPARVRCSVLGALLCCTVLKTTHKHFNLL